MIRRATEADNPRILEMGRRFFATTLYAQFAEYHEETMLRLIDLMRTSGVLLVHDAGDRIDGMVGLLIAPFLFDSRRLAAYEVMWWVEPDARGEGVGRALLEAIEPACREVGAVAIQMVRMENSPPSAERLYERCGYHASEFSHTKILESIQWQP